MGKNRIQPIIPNTKLRSSISAPNAFPKIGHIIFTENGVPNKTFTPSTPPTPPIITLTITGLSGVNKTYDGNDGGYLGGIPVLEGVLPEDIGLVNIEDNFFGGAKMVSSDVGTHIGIYLNDLFVLTGPSAYKYTYDPLTIIGYADITPAYLTITGITYSSKLFDGNTLGSWNNYPSLIGVLSEDIGLVNIEENPDPFQAGAQFVNIGPGNNIGCYVNDSFVLTGPLSTNYYFDPYAITGYANIF